MTDKPDEPDEPEAVDWRKELQLALIHAMADTAAWKLGRAPVHTSVVSEHHRLRVDADGDVYDTTSEVWDRSKGAMKNVLRYTWMKAEDEPVRRVARALHTLVLAADVHSRLRPIVDVAG